MKTFISFLAAMLVVAIIVAVYTSRTDSKNRNAQSSQDDMQMVALRVALADEVGFPVELRPAVKKIIAKLEERGLSASSYRVTGVSSREREHHVFFTLCPVETLDMPLDPTVLGNPRHELGVGVKLSTGEILNFGFFQ